jgi:hypothetical protein
MFMRLRNDNLVGPDLQASDVTILQSSLSKVKGSKVEDQPVFLAAAHHQVLLHKLPVVARVRKVDLVVCDHLQQLQGGSSSSVTAT